MFTILELTRPDWNAISVSLNVLADCIFFASLYWGHRRATGGKND